MNIRSLLATFYSAALSVIGFMLKWVQPRNRAVLLVSFQDNARALLNEYEKSDCPFEIEVLYTRHAVSLAKEYPSVASTMINEKNPVHLMRAVYRMFRSKCVITDNYFLLTSVLNKRPQTKCIQIWHANGALKKFGLEDIGNRHRTASDIKRFKKVYASFDYITVGSEKMADIFKRSFGIKDEQLLRTGVPLTDQYFQDDVQHVGDSGKKVILYAPTYRDYHMTSVKLPFSKEQLSEELKGEFLLLVKLHPAVRGHVMLEEHEGMIKDVSELPLKDLLYESDVLISDYSSIPFEYALLDKPMLFYTYDLKEYDEKRGLIDDYEAVIPGKACATRDMLLEELQNIQHAREKIQWFANEWNQYSKGDASRQLLDFVSKLQGGSVKDKSL
ncbi:CDP-glycerol--poly(glycerophosphate) glycerophosphotransferase [Bacillus sonorensis]|uniref:CDP-glycerol:polyglycerol phosphate glycerophosphotransferase TagB n=2 Tax=Bacillus sonorensis TaxID=119858 RepID=M5PD10_9BACI|nr:MULTISPECIES: CDP-glycerol--poly(glycerophosphate) glycerophosphotransferase [Bacillus]TWK80560.1 Teichoic acid glycerol-phosphate primase [Bacillus paralicheniformis]ASB87148.1 CDP-ribitol ribitolphosphotransferase [Bacillus sonorensis]EME73372.1 CDP-glycerol:polyglycerol phosphate glycerophosphotransferase TagB [Bacillus sonorensis L12]MBG9914358.1 CDP-glycerol:glycerophosphate glycerophosphotransferase [Bacillus sonorensis]MCY7857679.1 CDP-glycerol--poly(glycerophosphate) glycerophosphot